MKIRVYILLVLGLILVSPAWAYVDASLDAKTTALGDYLTASQGVRINVGVTRLTVTVDTNPTSGIKIPIMQTMEVMKYYDGANPMLWGGATQRAKLESYYTQGANVVMLSFNPFNPDPACSDGCSYSDTTGDPMHMIRVGDPERDKWLRHLDDLATELNTLSADGVAVILRLPQECNCPWFWWGSGNATAAEYVTFAREIVTYLRDTKGVHNVLYAYSPDTNTNAQCSEQTTMDGTRYPGDAYVDIITASFYLGTADTVDSTQLSTAYAALAAAAARTGKIWGIAEGAITIETTQKADFWTWYADFILADVNARNAAFINFWHSTAAGGRWPTSGSLWYVNFLQWQKQSKYSRFIWGFGSTSLGIDMDKVSVNGVTFK